METQLEWKQQVGKVKVQGRGKTKKTRWRRSVSKERYVEALLVADTTMMNFHQDGDVETYILTIMNMVSSLYRDASIGNSIGVVVVRIILLEDEIAQVCLSSITRRFQYNLKIFSRFYFNLFGFVLYYLSSFLYFSTFTLNLLFVLMSTYTDVVKVMFQYLTQYHTKYT